MRKYDLCIGGYAGCGNLGDDAILEGYLSSLSEGQRRNRVVVLSGKPRRDRRRFGVRCVGRKNLFSVLWCFLRSEVFVCGGGSLLQNATGNLSLFYYLGLLWLARLCGCKTRLMSAGIGPVSGGFAERVMIRTLRRCEKIEVRDRESERLLWDHGFDRGVVRLAEDPAMHLKTPPSSRLIFLKKEIGLGRDDDYFCVVVRQDGELHGACLGKIAAALRMFLKERNLTPVFVVFDAKYDLCVTEEFCRSVGGAILCPREARDALSIISGSRFLVSMRLHALVFASMTGVGGLAISPFDGETKISSFARAHHMMHMMPSGLIVPRLIEELVALNEKTLGCQN